MWVCCDRSISEGVKKCRTCGKDKPSYGVIEKPTNEKKSHKTSKKERDYQKNQRRIQSSLPEPEEGKYFISLLKRAKNEQR